MKGHDRTNLPADAPRLADLYAEAEAAALLAYPAGICIGSLF